MKFAEAIQLLVGVILLIFLVGIIFGWSPNTSDRIITWVIPAGISFALTAFSGELIENFTGEAFKRILITVPLGKYEFSLSLFTLLTFILKKWMFG